MKPEDAARLLRWYPPTWRDRYGEEVVIYLEDRFGPGRPPFAARRSLVVGGIRERARDFGLTRSGPPPLERMRAGTLVVFVSWTVFVVAVSSFAKLSEHFDTALPNGAGVHHLPDVAYAIVQTVTVVAGLAVVAGAALAAPALTRFLRSGGWRSLRGHMIRAAAATLVTGGTAIPIWLWAHQLTGTQRNGGLLGYGVLFLVWAALVALTLCVWTVVAVVAIRQFPLSPHLLFAEGLLAVAVAVMMLVVIAATAVWSGAMASKAPTFFGVGPLADLRLTASFGLMALAAISSLGGVVGIARAWLPVAKG